MSLDEALKTFPLILEEIRLLKKQNDLLINELLNKQDLTKSRDVCKYLNISKSTLDNYRNDGRFKEGIHFHKIMKNKRYNIIYVENAIKEYKVKNDIL